MQLLSDSLVTPNEIFFIRNHLPVPDIDENKYELEITGEGINTIALSLEVILLWVVSHICHLHLASSCQLAHKVSTSLRQPSLSAADAVPTSFHDLHPALSFSFSTILFFYHPPVAYLYSSWNEWCMNENAPQTDPQPRNDPQIDRKLISLSNFWNFGTSQKNLKVKWLKWSSSNLLEFLNNNQLSFILLVFSKNVRHLHKNCWTIEVKKKVKIVHI